MNGIPLSTLVCLFFLVNCYGGFELDTACDGVICSGHGRCVVEGSLAVCLCDQDFFAQGLECLPDTDADTFPDADSAPDADFSPETDSETDQDVDRPPLGTISSISAQPESGEYEIGSVERIHLDVTWEGPGQPGPGVSVSIMVEGSGQIGVAGSSAEHELIEVETVDDGTLPELLLAFPVVLSHIEVNLFYQLEKEEKPRLLAGPFTTSDFVLDTIEIEGTKATLRTLSGVRAEVYRDLIDCEAGTFEDNWNRVSSISLAHNGTEGLLVVNCLHEMWVFTASGDVLHQVTTPDAPDLEGPDRIVDTDFDPLSGILFAIGGGIDGGGGLYSLDLGCELPPSRFDGATDAASTEVEIVTDHVDYTNGVYWSGLGWFYRFEPLTGTQTTLFSSSYWPVSFAFGSAETYGNHNLIIHRCVGGECSPTAWEWLDNEGDRDGYDELTESHYPALITSHGGIWGDIVYSIESRQIGMIARHSDWDSVREVTDYSGAGVFVDGEFHREQAPEMNHHPPGFYLLLRIDEDGQVIRIFQDQP